MLRRFRIFLGPARFKAFVVLLGLTGIASLLLNTLADRLEWATAAQSLLLAVFLAGASYLILSRLTRQERLRWLAVILPAVLAIVIASAILPHLTGLFVGAGIGWIVAGIFVFNSTGGPQNYKRAVRAMRKGDYAAAIKSITAQIKLEPARGEHYRFRAELYRLAGKLEAAKQDYRRMINLEEQTAVAYNGLAEVELQGGNFQQAFEAAETAYEMSPQEWVAAYNLGMIEDRLGRSEGAIEHLRSALALKMPDSRHRLLAHLYLLRAYLRLGDSVAAAQALDAMKREKSGLEEWQVIMSADEAHALRDVLSEDIEYARDLIQDEKGLETTRVGGV
ncbi:MAG: tetratricopeptide repeat protein [Chloroflexota bacterium]|nr:tetratricopeptide repeat protein [Chloroflexota bacterium]